MSAWLPAWLPEQQKSLSLDREKASDLGALGGTRTPNLLIRSQMLYPLSYERLSYFCLPAVSAYHMQLTK
jgi:hypothetical protein